MNTGSVSPINKYDADFSSGAVERRVDDGSSLSDSDAQTAVKEEVKYAEDRRAQATHEERIKNMCQERELRDRYARKAYRVCKKCMYFLAFILVWQGVIATFCKSGPFSDTVLLALFTAVTVNVFAAFLCITKGLFQKEKMNVKDNP